MSVGLRWIVCVSSRMYPASLARLNIALDTVIAGPPGFDVWVWKTNSEAAFAVYVEMAKEMAGGA